MFHSRGTATWEYVTTQLSANSPIKGRGFFVSAFESKNRTMAMHRFLTAQDLTGSSGTDSALVSYGRSKALRVGKLSKCFPLVPPGALRTLFGKFLQGQKTT